MFDKWKFSRVKTEFILLLFSMYDFGEKNSLDIFTSIVNSLRSFYRSPVLQSVLPVFEARLSQVSTMKYHE